MTSSRLYSVVTKYWPRIAAGLVLVVAGADLVIGGLTADSALEFYLLAWAATTGGLWFLFETAEKALSEESREKVVGWLRDANLGSSIRSIPDQFAALFDRVFGARHVTWKCFWRSAVASMISVGIVAAVIIPGKSWGEDVGVLPLVLGAAAALLATRRCGVESSVVGLDGGGGGHGGRLP